MVIEEFNVPALLSCWLIYVRFYFVIGLRHYEARQASNQLRFGVRAISWKKSFALLLWLFVSNPMEDTSEELLLDTDDEQESTLNNPMVDMLAHINQNMQQMSESLKRLHGADEAESAKKVKKSHPLPESGSTASITNNDVVDLLQEGEEEVNNDGQEVDVLDESLNEAEKTELRRITIKLHLTGKSRLIFKFSTLNKTRPSKLKSCHQDFSSLLDPNEYF